jgi:hypothetical protein
MSDAAIRRGGASGRPALPLFGMTLFFISLPDWILEVLAL